MQKPQRNQAEILGDLNRYLASCNLSYRQLSEASGLSYDAARRYLVSRKAKDYSDNAKALCVFFGIQTDKTANLQTAPLERMTQAIHEVWDGSEPHAELIVELIKSTKSFKIDERG
jgi:hypothetical protein